jgi:preprotein translocase subunit SecA
VYSETLKPGIAFGTYPENRPERFGALDSAIVNGVRKIAHIPMLERYRAKQFAIQVEQLGDQIVYEQTGELMNRLKNTREQLRLHGAFDTCDQKALIEAFAVVRELSGRTLNMRHYRNQIMGGWLILNGMLAEMSTGEGKTLTAALPASIAALAGTPVHVLTTSDYLASRDAVLLAPLYAVLGLRVGVVTADMENLDDRRIGYSCDITYTTNKQVGFDYLRDRTSVGSPGRLSRLVGEALAEQASPILRGLCFAIVDEADSLLIDEARTPLKLSRQIGESPPQSFYSLCLKLAGGLRKEKDYTVIGKKIALTRVGQKQLKTACEKQDKIWHRRRYREECVRLALSAMHLFKRDEQYLVDEGKVHIIDANTGRRMKGRSWERGLHQLIETREGLETTPFSETVGKISYQQFFSHYLRLGGMSGTASEVQNELLATYKLPVIKVPDHCHLNRESLAGTVCQTHEEKLAAIVASVKHMHAFGRPVLIGTRTVGSSEELSQLLKEAGLKHRILNARQDSDEAKIVSQAGKAGSITIATNMAGRGTDISLGKGVRGLGGLHVIVSEHNEVRRLDRQLIGRCARQGDPGSYQYFLCPEDQIVMSDKVHIFGMMLNTKYLAANCYVRLLQMRNEWQLRRLRKYLTGSDQRLAEGLSFSGVN